MIHHPIIPSLKSTECPCDGSLSYQFAEFATLSLLRLNPTGDFQFLLFISICRPKPSFALYFHIFIQVKQGVNSINLKICELKISKQLALRHRAEKSALLFNYDTEILLISHSDILYPKLLYPD